MEQEIAAVATVALILTLAAWLGRVRAPIGSRWVPNRDGMARKANGAIEERPMTDDEADDAEMWTATK
jgi:hypothetical protein